MQMMHPATIQSESSFIPCKSAKYSRPSRYGPTHRMNAPYTLDSPSLMPSPFVMLDAKGSSNTASAGKSYHAGRNLKNVFPSKISEPISDVSRIASNFV